MDLLDLMVTVPSIIVGLIVGLVIGSLFIKITKNELFCLTPLGVKLFGKKTGFNNQFIGPIGGAIIMILDLTIIAIISGIVEQFVRIQMTSHPIFYFPFLLLVLTLMYNIIRIKSKPSFKLGEYFIITISYFSSIATMWALIK